MCADIWCLCLQSVQSPTPTASMNKLVDAEDDEPEEVQLSELELKVKKAEQIRSVLIQFILSEQIRPVSIQFTLSEQIRSVSIQFMLSEQIRTGSLSEERRLVVCQRKGDW